MHAVVVTVDIDTTRLEEANRVLQERTIPLVSGSDGFVRGTWMRSADGSSGRGVVLFETEDQAKAMAAAAEPPPDAAITMRSAEVFQVVAEA